MAEISDAAYRQAAIDEYAEEGHIEFKNGATVSTGGSADNGAYVAAWVWVSDDTVASYAGATRA